MVSALLVPTAPSVLRGMLLIVLATMAFALGDALTKQLAMRYPVSMVVGVRYSMSLGLLLLFLLPRFGAQLWRVQRIGLTLLRGLCLAAGSLAIGIAFQVMPVGESIAIAYLCPFIVMLLAVPLLGERVSLVGSIGVACGFAGVLLILRPGNDLDPLGVTFALLNAALISGYTLLTRKLAPTESTVAMLFHATLVGTVVFCPFAIGALRSIGPSAADFGVMLLIGSLSTLGHFLFTVAYRGATASLLAPITYTHIAWAGGFGWLLFGHIPDGLSVAGMTLIAAAGMTVAVHAHFARQRVLE